jgi:hypothetical protein
MDKGAFVWIHKLDILIYIFGCFPWVVSSKDFFCLTFFLRSRGGSVSIVSGYGLDDRAIEVQSLAGAKDFSSTLCVQTGSGLHPASCTMGTGDPLPGGKAQPGRDADNSPHLLPRSSRSYTPLPSSASMACSGTDLLYHFPTEWQAFRCYMVYSSGTELDVYLCPVKCFVSLFLIPYSRRLLFLKNTWKAIWKTTVGCLLLACLIFLTLCSRITLQYVIKCDVLCSKFPGCSVLHTSGSLLKLKLKEALCMSLSYDVFLVLSAQPVPDGYFAALSEMLQLDSGPANGSSEPLLASRLSYTNLVNVTKTVQRPSDLWGWKCVITAVIM